jgi:hypothetical protein
MPDFQLHLGEPPSDVLVRYPGKAYLSASIYPDARAGHEGAVRLRMDLVFQSGRKEVTFLSSDTESFPSKLAARDCVVELAQAAKVANVYLREDDRA